MPEHAPTPLPTGTETPPLYEVTEERVEEIDIPPLKEEHSSAE